jgi:AraC family transcriptional regulator, positive regulator of tynA and feaB
LARRLIVKVWSTDHVPPKQALSYWKDAVCDAFLKVQTEYDDTAGFQGTITCTPIGTLVANDVRSQSHIVKRNQQGIGRDRDDWFFVNLHKAGTCSLTQGRQTHTPMVGDFSFHDSTRPFDLRFHDDMALTCFVVPQSALLARTTDARSAVAKPLLCGGAGILFRNFASALAQAAPGLSVPEGMLAGNIFIDLLALALGANDDGREAARPAARRILFEQVCAHIRSMIADPELTISAAADGVHMAPRTLQTLFQAHGTSFTAFVIEQRLLLADRLLTRSQSMTVTDVAYAVGFSDLSHFSRMYRRRFELTARDRRGEPKKP